MHHVHVGVLWMLLIYFSWLAIRIPVLLVAYRFHRSKIAQALLQFA